MARALPLAFLALLLVPAVIGTAPEVCGVTGAAAGACAEEESAMVQVKAQQSSQKRASSATTASGDFDYKSFHLGDWPEIAPLCAGNSTTGFQAPINIAVNGADYESMPRKSWPKFYAKNGGCDKAYFIAKATAWQVDFMYPKENFDCKNLEMEWNGKVYVLVQFHFHTLSEDTVDFKPTPMQMHMVHLAADGSVAVVGVLITTDNWFFKNSFLDGVFKTGFESDRVVQWPRGQKFNPYEGVLSKNGEFWHYEGSFTTPPCTEGVDFLISQTHVCTSASYVTSYMEYLKGTPTGTGKGNSYGQNHRPIQPLNGRKISKGRFSDISSKGSVPDSGKLDLDKVELLEAQA